MSLPFILINEVDITQIQSFSPTFPNPKGANVHSAFVVRRLALWLRTRTCQEYGRKWEVDVHKNTHFIRICICKHVQWVCDLYVYVHIYKYVCVCYIYICVLMYTQHIQTYSCSMHTTCKGFSSTKAHTEELSSILSSEASVFTATWTTWMSASRTCARNRFRFQPPRQRIIGTLRPWK